MRSLRGVGCGGFEGLDLRGRPDVGLRDLCRGRRERSFGTFTVDRCNEGDGCAATETEERPCQEGVRGYDMDHTCTGEETGEGTQGDEYHIEGDSILPEEDSDSFPHGLVLRAC